VAGNTSREDRVFQEHATSSSPTASINRWKRDLSADQITRCNEAWKEFLEVFSYWEGGYIR
jgi:hypothetical protein